MWKLDIRRKFDKFLFVILIIALVLVIFLIFFSSILPKELTSARGAGLLGLILNFSGTFLLAVTLVKPDSKIKDMTATYFGGNTELEKDMFRNRRTALWGLILIASGFVFQFFDILISYYTK